MKKRKTSLARILADRKGTILLLGGTYLFFVLIRFLLCYTAMTFPSVMIDEGLYYSMARSISMGQGLLFCGQPANYSFILYPLILSPIYALFPEGTDYYRAMQLWNFCLITTSLFPLYSLGKKITKNPVRAYGLAVISLLLADFSIGGHIMSENILFPMFFLLMLFLYEYIAEGKKSRALWIGVLGGLMFATKPGDIVPAAAALLFCLILEIREKNKQGILWNAGGILAALAVSAGCFALVVFGFGHPVSVFSIYEMQMQPSVGEQTMAFLQGLLLTPYYFLIGCGGIALLLPLKRYSEFSSGQKQFLLVTLLSLAAFVIGTAWTVNRMEVNKVSVHLRYIAMYMPLLLIFCFMPANEKHELQEKKEHRFPWPIPVFGLYMIAVSVFMGCRFGTAQEGSCAAFHLSVAFLRDFSLPAGSEWLGNGLICLFALILCLLLNGKKKKLPLEKIAVGCFLLAAILSNGALYREAASVHQKQDDIPVIQEATGDEDYLFIYGNNTTWYDVSLNINTRKETNRVYYNDFFNHIVTEGGVYSPFLPDKQRGTLPTLKTPDTCILVVDQDVLPKLELTENVEVLTEPDRTMIALRITRGERIADSALGGIIGNKLTAGSGARLVILDPDKQVESITLDVEFPRETEFIYSYGSDSISFTFPAGRDQYTITGVPGINLYGFSCKDHDINIYGYTIHYAGE